MPSLDEYIEEISDMWETHKLTNMGEKHVRLEKELEKYLMCDHIELVVNGHMALEMSLQALDIKGEVITTPFTFASTTHAITRSGLKPVFCDINEDDYTIDVRQLESLINSKTSAIMPVHVYGNICNIEEINRIAKKYNLKVIYDAAHAFGEKYKGQGVGSFGDASCFSFHATKVFNTIEGGAVSYHDERLGNRIYELKNFGIHGEESVQAVGANAKMNEFCAAMGLCNLKHVEEEINKRKEVFDVYMQNLEGFRGIGLPHVSPDTQSNYAYFPITIDEQILGVNRDQLADYLKVNGIYVRKYFFPLTCDFDCYKKSYYNQNVPVARKISGRILTLPLYSELEEEVVDKICKLIYKYTQKEK